MGKMWRAAAALTVMAAVMAGEPAADGYMPEPVRAEAAEVQWTWITSDQKYGKFFAPANVQIKSSVNGVATCISAWIKTAYTPGGAQEAIANYGIETSIPDPRTLSYSLALVEVIPQERKISYIQENFYDAAGKVIWSRVYEPPKEYEVNHLSFEEDYYVALVDQVFRHGERQRKDAEDRWKLLWTTTAADGSVMESMADSTTMRLSGNNLIYWEWLETRDKAGQVKEIKFLKKALNYDQGTEKIVKGDIWTAAAGWQPMATDGRYETIPKDSKAYPGLERLRAIVKGYQYWLNRYRTDLPQTGNAKRTGK